MRSPAPYRKNIWDPSNRVSLSEAKHAKALPSGSWKPVPEKSLPILVRRKRFRFRFVENGSGAQGGPWLLTI